MQTGCGLGENRKIGGQGSSRKTPCAGISCHINDVPAISKSAHIPLWATHGLIGCSNASASTGEPQLFLVFRAVREHVDYHSLKPLPGFGSKFLGQKIVDRKSCFSRFRVAVV